MSSREGNGTSALDFFLTPPVCQALAADDSLLPGSKPTLHSHAIELKCCFRFLVYSVLPRLYFLRLTVRPTGPVIIMVSAAELQAMHEQQNASKATSAAPVRDPFPSIGGGGGGSAVQDPFPATSSTAGQAYSNGLASGSNGRSNGARQPDL